MRVVVFGGSQPSEGSIAYREAQALGQLLARRGHTVLTGGYTGTMEAVSRGAAEAGGHVIGVTCDDIGTHFDRVANRWVMEEHRHATLFERLHDLINGSDAAIALPGGPGTLTEIALTWNLMIVGTLRQRPLVLVGDGWRQLVDTLYAQLGDYVPQSQRELLHFATTAAAGLDVVESLGGQDPDHERPGTGKHA